MLMKLYAKRPWIICAVLGASALIEAVSCAAEPAPLGNARSQAFDYALLKGQARWLAGMPYQTAKVPLADALAKMTYDQYQSIRFKADHALWADEPLDFRLQFFHTGRSFAENVRLYEVQGGQAREIVYDPAMFDYEKSGVDAATLRDHGGFAGFRIQSITNWKADVAAFLGATYFRAVGDTRQYGLSARGLAVDTALNRPEEFPRFTSYWFEKPVKNSGVLVIYALMDSPSVTGAYRFTVNPGATFLMDVDVALYPRKDIERLGVAPLTSMFQMGENDRRVSNDWRPEIHDSDGLSIWNGNGEWIWRPVMNPAHLRVNSYLDENPHGFGLLQRDRNFDHYQDDNVYYDKRPSLWIEPRVGASGAGWGKGAVQLVEIPTIDETFDNIVVFWNPAEPAKAGQELLFGYRMYWGTQIPASPPLAQTVATRLGIGGIVGQKRKYFSWHFTVDFAGGDLAGLARDADVDAVITSSRGQLEHVTAHAVREFNGYRALFDVRLNDDSVEPVDLRMFLRIHGRPLTETWIYQWVPPSAKERKLMM
jgi:periplasmic glucans biosynthesis protein